MGANLAGSIRTEIYSAFSEVTQATFGRNPIIRRVPNAANQAGWHFYSKYIFMLLLLLLAEQRSLRIRLMYSRAPRNKT